MVEKALTKEDVQQMLENHMKSLELSSVKDELERLRKENQDLVTRLASAEDNVEAIQETVQEVVTEPKEETGKVTPLGEVLEKVAGLENIVADFEVKFEEISSRLNDICSNIKTVTPLEAGIGKMSSTETAEEVVEEETTIEETPAEDESMATDEEVALAIDVIEQYIDSVGTLPEVVEKSSIKAKRAVRSLKGRKSEVSSRREKVSKIREQIRNNKPVETASEKRKIAIDKLRAKLGKAPVVETSSFKTEDYEAGSLAEKMFSKLR